MSQQDTEFDGLQPTLVHETGAANSLAGATAADVSRAPVAFVEGGKPRLADETAALLRRRLKAAALILSITLGFAFVRSLFLPAHPLMALRATILVAMIGSYLALRSQWLLSLRQLRLIELVVFGGFTAQVLIMVSVLTYGFAASGDEASTVGVQHLTMGAFSVFILIYGMLMPNTWRRAALVLLPMACLPYVQFYVMRWQSADVAQALDADQLGTPVPLPLIAAFAAVYGTHVINSIRREAFKAKQFGQYRLKEKLGSGGMGEVYRAEHMLLKRPCAIKLIREGQGADAAALARFEREVQATARLTHWNTVEIFDYGHTDDATFYYVMELLPGKSLEDLVKDHGPLPPERVVHFLRQTCRALKEAHGIGLIHRDLKPANVFAAKRGGICDVVKLLDFGLVKQTASDRAPEDANLTQVGTFSGSPLYMPPEQATSYGEVDGRADIYSLGGVAYFLLTGQAPFSGRNPMEVLLAHARDPVMPPSKVAPGVPADLEAVVLRCLQKNPQDRFQDVERLENALAQCESADQWTEQEAIAWWRQTEQDIDGP